MQDGAEGDWDSLWASGSPFICIMILLLWQLPSLSSCSYLPNDPPFMLTGYVAGKESVASYI